MSRRIDRLGAEASRPCGVKGCPLPGDFRIYWPTGAGLASSVRCRVHGGEWAGRWGLELPPPLQPERPQLRLLGTDGNAFAILGKALRAGRAAGWSQPKLDAFQAAATGGDYNELLRAVQEAFDVC